MHRARGPRRGSPRRGPQCKLPWKPIVTGTIDMHAVLQHARGAHKRAVLEATALLAGTHAAWQPLLQSHGGGTVRSTLTAEQLAGALSMGLIRPTAGRPRITAALFAIPKSDGTTARPIDDARRQNELIDWSAVRTSLRLIAIVGHVRVGLAVRVATPELIGVDARSYFPSFRWADRLARCHGLVVDGTRYVHRVPAQGCALMPLVAQVTSAALADGPCVDAPAVAWERSRLSICYDNWLKSAERGRGAARLAHLTQRLRACGVVGTVTDPTTQRTSCGLEFDVASSLAFEANMGNAAPSRRM
jgi:hypothetical protein